MIIIQKCLLDMDGENIRKLIEELSSIGVCGTGLRWLNGKKKDIALLIKVWRQWPEYLYEHSEYALELFRKHLTEQDMEYLATEHLFIDWKGTVEINLDNSSYPIFFLGESNCAVRVSDYGVAKIYVFNKSHLDIICKNRAISNVEAFDSSLVYANNDDTSKCTIYSYDNSSVVGNAHIIRKEYRRGEVFNGKEMAR